MSRTVYSYSESSKRSLHFYGVGETGAKEASEHEAGKPRLEEEKGLSGT